MGSVPQPVFEPLLESLVREAQRHYGQRLRSLVVYGSVARGTAGPLSDLDILIVGDDLPNGRGARIREFEPVERAVEPERKALFAQGFRMDLSPVFKTPSEVEHGSLLFLDMTLDARILFDRDDYFAKYLDILRARLRALGSRRIPFKGGYYWLLKPDLKPGEVIEI